MEQAKHVYDPLVIGREPAGHHAAIVDRKFDLGFRKRSWQSLRVIWQITVNAVRDKHTMLKADRAASR